MSGARAIPRQMRSMQTRGDVRLDACRDAADAVRAEAGITTLGIPYGGDAGASCVTLPVAGEEDDTPC